MNHIPDTWGVGGGGGYGGGRTFFYVDHIPIKQFRMGTQHIAKGVPTMVDLWGIRTVGLVQFIERYAIMDFGDGSGHGAVNKMPHVWGGGRTVLCYQLISSPEIVFTHPFQKVQSRTILPHKCVDVHNSPMFGYPIILI